MDKYKIEEEPVGRGTYGIVKRATDIHTQKFVALKYINLVDDEGIPSTALREIALLKALQHPNIINLLDVVHLQNTLIIIFDFMELDLKKYLDSLPPNQLQSRLECVAVKSLTLQILQGLRFCHSQDIVHRDMKPANLLLSRTGKCVLADFGLSRTLVFCETSPLKCEVVTLWYRAPELLFGAINYSTEIDIWSMGCILVEMATTAPLFPAASEIWQIETIFELLGLTPDEHNYFLNGIVRETPLSPEQIKLLNDAVKQTEKVLKESGTDIYSYRRMRLEERAPLLKHDQSGGIDLVLQMLAYIPHRRVTAAGALASSFFRELLENTAAFEEKEPRRSKPPLYEDYSLPSLVQKASPDALSASDSSLSMASSSPCIGESDGEKSPPALFRAANTYQTSRPQNQTQPQGLPQSGVKTAQSHQHQPQQQQPHNVATHSAHQHQLMPQPQAQVQSQHSPFGPDYGTINQQHFASQGQVQAGSAGQMPPGQQHRGPRIGAAVSGPGGQAPGSAVNIHPTYMHQQHPNQQHSQQQLPMHVHQQQNQPQGHPMNYHPQNPQNRPANMGNYHGGNVEQHHPAGIPANYNMNPQRIHQQHPQHPQHHIQQDPHNYPNNMQYYPQNKNPQQQPHMHVHQHGTQLPPHINQHHHINQHQHPHQHQHPQQHPQQHHMNQQFQQQQHQQHHMNQQMMYQQQQQQQQQFKNQQFQQQNQTFNNRPPQNQMQQPLPRQGSAGPQVQQGPIQGQKPGSQQNMHYSMKQ